MNTIDQIKSHSSIRKFVKTKISKEDLQDIVQCAVQTSTAGNMQAWSVVVTEDQNNLEKMATLQYGQEFIHNASVHLTFCADYYRIKRWVEYNGGKNSFDNLCGFMTGVVDAAIASQNAVLAAESKGFGVCYLGTTLWNAEKISEFLELPELVVPVTSFVLGIPDEKPEFRKRLDLKAVWHEEKYHQFEEVELREMYHHLDHDGTERIKSNNVYREKMIELGIENIAQFYVSEAKYGPKLFKKISCQHLNLLKEKGYWNF